MVILKGSVAISFEMNKTPAAYAEIVSMGGINSDVKKKLIATIGTILQSKLSVPRTRFFLKVYDTTAGRNYSKLWQMCDDIKWHYDYNPFMNFVTLCGLLWLFFDRIDSIPMISQACLYDGWAPWINVFVLQ